MIEVVSVFDGRGGAGRTWLRGGADGGGGGGSGGRGGGKGSGGGGSDNITFLTSVHFFIQKYINVITII